MTWDLSDEQLAVLRHLIALDARKPEIKAYFDELDATLLDAQRVFTGDIYPDGTGAYFAENEQAPIFKLVKPAGTFVQFKPLGLERTKLAGEVRGSLSVKEAESALRGLEVFLLAENAARNSETGRKEYIRAVLNAWRNQSLDVLAVYQDAYAEKERATDESIETWLISCAEQDWDDGREALCFPQLLKGWSHDAEPGNAERIA